MRADGHKEANTRAFRYFANAPKISDHIYSFSLSVQIELFAEKEYVVMHLVQTLRYKPEGRGFCWGMRFYIYLILPAALWPWGRLSL